MAVFHCILIGDVGRLGGIYAFGASRLVEAEDGNHEACRRRPPSGDGVVVHLTSEMPSRTKCVAFRLKRPIGQFDANLAGARL